MPTIPTRKTGTEEEEEEEEEEDLRTFYNPDSSAEEETSDNTRYQPPYEVVISSLMPFGRPNLRGLLSYSGSKKLNRLVSRPPKNSIRRVLNVTETLFYATLNHSSPQVIALFAHDIVQECVQRTPFMPYQCQPHYDTMPNSSKKYFNFHRAAFFFNLIDYSTFPVVILEHSPDGPDWRDVVFASRTLVVNGKNSKIQTSLHSLKLSKDISQVKPIIN